MNFLNFQFFYLNLFGFKIPVKQNSLPKEREIYSLEEVQKMLELFEDESEANFKYTIFFTLAAFTGLRRGELLGLEWKDIDWDNQLLNVVRTSEYTKEKGIYTDTPKSKSSVRIIKLPVEVIEKLREFRYWQNEQSIRLGSKWVNTDRLFTKWNGEPMGMRSPYKFFEKRYKFFRKRFLLENEIKVEKNDEEE